MKEPCYPTQKCCTQHKEYLSQDSHSKNQPITSFPPVNPQQPRVMILGSMPGVKSLEAQEYYAHPQNLFWAFMDEILDVDRGQSYQQRLQALASKGILLWDVLKHCVREGSLDSKIQTHTEVPNDIDVLLEQHASLKTVLFNGKKAEQAFQKHIQPKLSSSCTQHLRCHTLPSTSPANASIPKKQKQQQWQEALAEVCQNT